MSPDFDISCTLAFPPALYAVPRQTIAGAICIFTTSSTNPDLETDLEALVCSLDSLLQRDVAPAINSVTAPFLFHSNR